MLSTQYRLRLEKICERIATHQEVSLEEMIWAEKLSKANQTAAKFLRQARRTAENPEMQKDDLDDFLNQLDIGGLGNERGGIRGFNSPDEIAEWFSRDKDDDEENWRRRD
jgi:membrane protein involved in colicin uptake